MTPPDAAAHLAAHRTNAFAGLVQAALLVDRTAHNRSVDRASTVALTDAVFATNLEDPAELFGDLAPWTIGLETAYTLLGRPGAELTVIAKRTITVMQIALDLRRQPKLMAQLRQEIDDLRGQRSKLDDDALIAALGAVYQRTLSTLPRRVHVTGDPAVLQRPEVAGRIRALLLGGVRTAWLWHALGGRRWHLLLKRTTMRRALRLSLDELHRSSQRH